MRRRIKIIFTCSVLLNVVLIALVLGTYYRFQRDASPTPEMLSPQSQEILSNTFRQGREEIGPLFGSMKAERAKVETILRSENFDAAGYDIAVDSMLDARELVTRKKAEIMGRAMVELSAQERQKFAGYFLDKLEGRYPHKGKGRCGHGREENKDVPPPPAE